VLERQLMLLLQALPQQVQPPGRQLRLAWHLP
jgi:hypothetical protein